jgi:hypothetical protein
MRRLRTREAIGAIIHVMDITPFNAPVSAKGRAKVIKIRDGTEVAARHFDSLGNSHI